MTVDSLKALDPNRPIREEKHEPASDPDTVTVDSLKALDPNRPIREAEVGRPVPGPTIDGRDFAGDVGLAGPDRGKGGKYLLLPPNYKGTVPDGYFVYHPLTNNVFVFWRAFENLGFMSKSAAGFQPAAALEMYVKCCCGGLKRVTTGRVSEQRKTASRSMPYRYRAEPSGRHRSGVFPLASPTEQAHRA